jgi:hypothetical protein
MAASPDEDPLIEINADWTELSSFSARKIRGRDKLPRCVAYPTIYLFHKVSNSDTLLKKEHLRITRHGL